MRRAQANYLAQFASHRNPYTGLTYAEDPNIIAFEIFNEPRHPAGPEETTRYIDAMVDALRGAGLEKPIFYNISENFTPEHGGAVCAAGALPGLILARSLTLPQHRWLWVIWR